MTFDTQLKTTLFYNLFAFYKNITHKIEPKEL